MQFRHENVEGHSRSLFDQVKRTSKPWLPALNKRPNPIRNHPPLPPHRSRSCKSRRVLCNLHSMSHFAPAINLSPRRKSTNPGVKHREIETEKELDCPPDQSVNVTDRYISLYIRMETGIMDVSEQLTSLPEMNKAALGALWQKHFGAPHNYPCQDVLRRIC
jgi:hypothetical protein